MEAIGSGAAPALPVTVKAAEPVTTVPSGFVAMRDAVVPGLLP